MCIRDSYHALGIVLCEHVYMVFVFLSQLEFEICGGLGHLLPVAADQACGVAFENRDYLLYHRAVLLLGDGPYAATLAAAYLEIQTGTKFVPEYGLRVYLEPAGADGVIGLEEIEQFAGVEGRAVRPEVTRAVAYELACQINPGERICADTYPRIGLGILEQDVVLWLVLLDKVVFKQQGIGLGVHHGVLGISNLAYQNPGLGIEPGWIDEVLRNPLVQVLGFAYIYHISLGVVVSVDSGGMWE